MKKRILAIFISVLLISNISACNYVPKGDIQDQIQESSSDTSTPKKELETILNPNFSSSPFLRVVEGSDPLTDDEIKSIIRGIPDSQYETYPNLHDMPIAAILYKGDKIVPVNLNDTRLIRLINFYNNSVYYDQYSYTQGLLSIDYLEAKVLNEDFRLVLTFIAKNNSTSVSYDTNIQAYDTIVITNQWFVLIGHDLQGYEGQEDKYPYRAVGHIPLFNNYCWLDLFGF